MAGLYLHIPFCKQACHYCNFHFSTSLKNKDAVVAALLQELRLQKDYLSGEPLETIYFGGGTPSLLSQHDLDLVFNEIFKRYPVASGSLEVTLEANPDDLTALKINELRTTPINRLSIGVQSFSEADLRFMHRAHDATEALASIQQAQQAGFENLTIDLIYGSPTTSHEQWVSNLKQAFALNIQHLSCYCLTVEPKTALAHQVKKGVAQPVDDEHAAQQFELLMDMTAHAGYEHYEISNFALPGWHSRHNSSYWQGKKYLGVGPSAHSFNGTSRQWNVSNNASYVRALDGGALDIGLEVLTPTQRYNEYVMTGLRTKWGCSLLKIKDLGFEAAFAEGVKPFLEDGSAERQGDVFRLTRSGRFLADGIAAALFAEEEAG
ncbi:MAG: radical SAM family heme chaperone HemW [Saprospiraceae bacterium]|jgi:oxygen-independent coproporphyrinogen-3 oxidase|nr:radical SAM family heme chaperone HemW [Saprospiraceae bacterium]